MSVGLSMFIIAQVFAVISMILLLYSYTKENIDELLYFQILVSVFEITSYFLLGADAGLLICLIELVKTYLYYKTDKDNIIFNISIILYILVGLLVFKHWFAVLPVLGSIIDSYGTSKSSKAANICSIISNILWIIYDIIILSYVGAVNDALVIICNVLVLITGYSRVMRISKFRIVKTRYLSKKARGEIYELDQKNYGAENLWDKDYQYRLFKKNKDSFFLIIHKHSVVGYINYFNVTYEEYNRIKSIKKYSNYIDEDKILPFKSNRKAYIVIESININSSYEKDETIKLISKNIKYFIKDKYRKRIYIHGILGIALTNFERKVFENIDFSKVKDLEDDISLYELDESKINYR